MFKKYVFHTKNEAQTTALGEAFGKLLKAGDVVAMDGDLGAGKTHFTYGIAKALEIDEYITSPTFTIVNEYRSGYIPLFHFDAYRLSSEDELYDIGYDDYLVQNGVIVIEWAINTDGVFDDKTIRIEILRMDDVSESDRTINIFMDERADNIVDTEY
ncbi:MAG: tRNA (adenosine(37)-N6)-threonylcarbamoyltransferase complex ATPase subunit type 1 TsaE [Ruminococcaceae bacterium]|nr:tRNA (adenosine(37)-N6)-threonylcarbamoyltransferase complex ATPase subunit type 1 TsaE [Oscillospiraceae bacterium]